RIAKDSKYDYWAVMEILTAFVREQTQEHKEPRPRADIQAILTVLGRRTGRFGDEEPYELDLRRAQLQGAFLQGANLQRANLRRANLQGANLRRANLQGADLYAALLQGANFLNANLRGANLREADVTQAEISSAYTDENTKLA